MGEAAFQARCNTIRSAIRAKEIILGHLNVRLVAAEWFEDEDDAIAEREAVEPRKKEAEKAITAFERLLVDITTNWADEESRVIGHVTLSPPICPNYGKDGFTDDWAVIQIHPSMVTKTNFLGNAIDLGSVEPGELTAWMYPHHANDISFKYPLTVSSGSPEPSPTKKCSNPTPRRGIRLTTQFSWC